jgi:hypothetical protein
MRGEPLSRYPLGGSVKYIIEYDSNNSGGGWWLSDKDWNNLADAGWEVQWIRNDRKDIGSTPDKSGRWLGAMACEAHFEVESDNPGAALRIAVQHWENTTGKDSSLEGCTCCGPPHNFAVMKKDEDGNLVRDWGSSISGEEIAFFLDGRQPMSTRELLDELKRRDK